MSMSVLNPFQLLELNVISAQDLAQVARNMKTYAVAWVHPDRTLSTRVDNQGNNNPTWNDKFVFRVDDEFLHQDTSAVMIEIYAVHWFRDIHVGTVRILVGNLIPSPSMNHYYFHHQPQVGMRFVALQVRRASGRPQGILNIGVALLHSSMRSMPLYSQLSTSAVGYRQLMGEDDPHHHHGSQIPSVQVPTSKVELRRSKSDTSSMMGSEDRSAEMMAREKRTKSKASSRINASDVSTKKKSKGRSKATSLLSAGSIKSRKAGKASSMISASDYGEDPSKMGKKGKASSLINGSDIRDNSVRGKPGSILNGSDLTPIVDPPVKRKGEKIRPIARPEFVKTPSPGPKLLNEKSRKSPAVYPTPRRAAYGSTPVKSYVRGNDFKYETPRKSFLGARAFMTESELGPSPSEVAAAMAAKKVDDGGESSIVDGWSVDESVEGLQSKLDRWRTELPPVYDNGSALSSSEQPRHKRRSTDGDGGLFSCFSNICGLQCSIVCGGESPPKKGSGGLMRRSPSAGALSYL